MGGRVILMAEHRNAHWVAAEGEFQCTECGRNTFDLHEVEDGDDL